MPPRRIAITTPVGLAALLLCLGSVALTFGRPLAAAAQPYTAAPRSGVPIYWRWLRVDPQHPSTLFVGGTRFCSTYLPSDPSLYCPHLLLRSTDGGTTWSNLTAAIGLDPDHTFYLSGGMGLETYLSPVKIAADGQHLYLDTRRLSPSPYAPAAPRYSADGGLSWSPLSLPGAGASGGAYGVTLGGLPRPRLYTIYDAGNSHFALASSGDYGQSWQIDGRQTLPPVSSPEAYTVAADPATPNRVYVTIAGAYAMRSDDAGAHWNALQSPPGLRTFAVGFDPHDGTSLVGQTHDIGVPADRRYLSRDGGRTWRVAACPGDLDGECPRFTVDNTFGAGASYGFLSDGIYRFQGAGGAAERLSLSDHLPFDPGTVLDVEVGTHVGDPIYVLAKGSLRGASGRLYRSADAGATWQELTLNLLPNLAPPSGAPGTLYVPASGHSVAAPFAATYRRMGLYLLGHPVTEAYTDGVTLTQDFDHLRLQLVGGRVVVGSLADGLLFYQATLSSALAASARVLPAAPAGTASRLYFPQTGHSLQGDMLRYWRAHGGMAIFGAPISEVFQGQNYDGSGRAYAMQWFQNARLEEHPENHDPRFTILLGLLGRELWG